MNSAENSFGLDLHQNHIQHLEEAGFKVCSGWNTRESDGSAFYYALVILEIEYIEKLNDLNANLYAVWCEDEQKALLSGKPFQDFLRLQILDKKTLTDDPRYKESNSAWGALVESEEYAAKMVDNAPLELYYSLDDTPDNLIY